jgi:hypothetical protein
MIENTINKLFSSKSQFNCPACPQVTLFFA